MSALPEPSVPVYEFRMPCYLALKRALGEIDACAECLEIARRELESTLLATDDLPATLQSLSAKHGIKVDSVQLDTLRTQTIGLHLIAIRQCFESFETAFLEEHPRFKKATRKKKENKSKFVFRVMRLGRLEHTFEFKAYEYYRLLRNSVAHSSQAGEKKTLRKTAVTLRGNCSHGPYVKLRAPNLFPDIAFDDYVLFSRVTKSLAKKNVRAIRGFERRIQRMV